MGRAVEVFRQNAVELDQLLAERAEAAARLEKIVEQRTEELAGRGATLRVMFDNMPQVSLCSTATSGWSRGTSASPRWSVSRTSFCGAGVISPISSDFWRKKAI